MTPSGLLVVRDALALGPWEQERRSPRQHRPPGDTRAEHVLLRTVKCIHGSVEVAVDCEPMFDYGRLAARWSYRGLGYHAATATNPEIDLTLRLDTNLRLGFEGGRSSARATLRESEQAFVALSWSDGSPPDGIEFAEAMSLTQIVKTFNEENVPGSIRSSKGWSPATISRILDNEKYAGRWIWNRTESRREPEDRPAPAL
jgi:hypothetical protein